MSLSQLYWVKWYWLEIFSEMCLHLSCFQNIIMGHKCDRCGKVFTTPSNLRRHKKVHDEKAEQCPECDKTFTLKQHLKRHLSQHTRPNLQLYNSTEAKLAATPEAKRFTQGAKRPVDAVWSDAKSSEKEARKQGGDEWRGQVVVTSGKYAGRNFRWLLENDVGWVVWLLHEYTTQGDKNPFMKWQKEQMLAYVKAYAPVYTHLEKKLKVRAILLFYFDICNC